MEPGIIFNPIGIIHTPFLDAEGMPIQAAGATGVTGTIELDKEFVAGLKDLDGFSHIILIYHLHRVQNFELTVIPFLDTKPHGIFACRSPLRPNPIGISVVKLVGIENNLLYIEDVDMLDGTPLLDIKPFVSEFDNRVCDKQGWLKGKESVEQVKSDKRFSGK